MPRGVRTTCRSRSKFSADTVADTLYVPLCRVVRTHGLKGEVSVATAPGLPLYSLVGSEVWLVPPPRGPRSGTIESVRPGPKGELVKVTGFDDLESAGAMVGCELLVARNDLPDRWMAPQPEESMLGRSVVDETRGDLGVIVEVILTGANDVWVVEGPFGEVLIPVIEDVVVGPIRPDTPITVRLLEGLLADEGESV